MDTNYSAQKKNKDTNMAYQFKNGWFKDAGWNFWATENK